MSRRLAQFVLRILASAAGCAALHASDCWAERSLGDLSIEELMNESITSVSKRDQKLGDAAAAVTVLSNEDLRRAGVTNIVDALRLVPGMDVGALNASQWAVSTRGFNNLYANKLLVLIDGRVVYTPLFAGVYWELQQTLLEDVERIEIIRGPGATVWGANAVNGVVNVITRRAGDSQGALVYAGGGAPQKVLAGSRYGGKLDEDTDYRVYGSYQQNEDNLLSDGQPAGDRWKGWQTGFRVDRQHDADTHLTWQGDFSSTRFDADISNSYNFNTLGRWTRELSATSELEIQAYYDRVYRHEMADVQTATDTFDFNLQHAFALDARNELMWSAAYRHIESEAQAVGTIAQVRRPRFGQQIFSAFLQDEFKLVPDKIILTGGVKFERNDFTGVEIQPSVRAAFKPAAAQTLWMAVSRAARTPRVLEGRDVFAVFYGSPFQGPDGAFYVPTLVGNPSLKSEILWAYELGYRIQVTPQLNIDAATFYNKYDGLIAPNTVRDFVPAQPVGLAQIPWVNLLHGESHGGELAVQFSPRDTWRLTANYSLLRAHLRGSTPDDLAQREHSSPEHQASLRVSHDFSPQLHFDSQLRYVSSIDSAPAYFTADVRVAYELSKHWEFSLVGQNLLDRSHAEQAPLPGSISSEVRRGAYAKFTGRF